MANILIVDDDRELTTAVNDALSHRDHTVTALNDGPSAWHQLKSKSYELVILDWDMPELDGIELLNLMRTSGDTTPVIMLTARGAIDDRIKGLDSGANDYLTKPFDCDELSARIRAVLRTKTAPPPPPKALGLNNESVLQRGNLFGTTLAAHYEFLDVIGEGGAAQVFKARHPQLDKLVAVKMLHGGRLSGDAVSCFVHEARIASKLDHPNIVTVFDFGITEHEQPYMVMELVDGPNLYQFIEQKEFLPINEALPILLPTSAALAYAHDLKILHRDVKPENIVLKTFEPIEMRPIILDFGLARVLEFNPSGDDKIQPLAGSPPYMSPEQVQKKPLDERSDIYSFGCVIFETVTGYAPFIGDDRLELALMRLEQPPLTLAEARPSHKYPAELQRIITKALELKPENRYQSMHDLHEDLSLLAEKLEDTSIWSRLKKLRWF